MTQFFLLRFKYPFHLMRHERTFFTFKEYTSRLHAFYIVPDILGYIHSVESILRAKNYAFYHCTIIIVGIHFNSTTK